MKKTLIVSLTLAGLMAPTFASATGLDSLVFPAGPILQDNATSSTKSTVASTPLIVPVAK